MMLRVKVIWGDCSLRCTTTVVIMPRRAKNARDELDKNGLLITIVGNKNKGGGDSSGISCVYQQYTMLEMDAMMAAAESLEVYREWCTG